MHYATIHGAMQFYLIWGVAASTSQYPMYVLMASLVLIQLIAASNNQKKKKPYCAAASMHFA